LQSEHYGFQEVRNCLDGEATIKTVTEGLQWLFGKNSQGEGTQVTSEDRLAFYYSGHGFRTEKDGVLRECLCLYDGFFFDDELGKHTQGPQPGIFTVVLDSCHSGGMDKRFFETLSSKGRISNWVTNALEIRRAI
jgi:caspase domain-containing protein